jgi:hypothetical protein
MNGTTNIMLTSTNVEKQDVMDFVMEDASHH